MQLVVSLVILLFSKAIAGNFTRNTMVLKQMSKDYGRTVYICLNELKLELDVLTDYLYFWKPKYEFTNRASGCAAICINKKLNLMDETGSLSKPRALAWVKESGGDDNLSSYLVSLYQSCEAVAKTPEACEKALQVTNCFRRAVLRAQSSPKVRVEVKALSDG